MRSCSIAHQNLENNPKLGLLPSILPKWPNDMLATKPLELCYLKEQTNLPKMKQEITSSRTPILCPRTQNTSLNQQETQADTSLLHWNYYMR